MGSNSFYLFVRFENYVLCQKVHCNTALIINNNNKKFFICRRLLYKVKDHGQVITHAHACRQ